MFDEGPVQEDECAVVLGVSDEASGGLVDVPVGFGLVPLLSSVVPVVLDLESRRGVESVNRAYGNKLAILAGDFLLARASVALARLRNVEVVEIVSTVIEHLVKGT